MVLDKNLYDEINEYCKLNGLKTRDLIHKMLKEAFLKEKYGDTPFNFINNKTSKHNDVNNNNIINILNQQVVEVKKDEIISSNENDEKLVKIEENLENVVKNEVVLTDCIEKTVEETINDITKENLIPQKKKKRKLN